MKILIAHRRHHADYYIRQILGDNPANYKIITEAFQLNGLDRGIEVVLLVDKNYVPSRREMDNRNYIEEVCKARSFKTSKVWV